MYPNPREDRIGWVRRDVVHHGIAHESESMMSKQRIPVLTCVLLMGTRERHEHDPTRSMLVPRMARLADVIFTPWAVMHESFAAR